MDVLQKRKGKLATVTDPTTKICCPRSYPLAIPTHVAATLSSLTRTLPVLVLQRSLQQATSGAL